MDEQMPPGLVGRVTVDAHGLAFDAWPLEASASTPFAVAGPVAAMIAGLLVWAGTIFTIKSDLAVTYPMGSPYDMDSFAVWTLFASVPLALLGWFAVARLAGLNRRAIRVVADADGIVVSTLRGRRIARHPRHLIRHCYAPPDIDALVLHLEEPHASEYLYVELGEAERRWLAREIQEIAAAGDPGEHLARGVVEAEAAKLRRDVKDPAR